MSIDKYDEYVNGEEREVITVNTRIKASNKGFMMLANMGWSDGQPLGLAGDGRVDPVPFYVKNDLTGLGKANQDVRMIESTVSQRRGLEVERQTKETEEQRKAREDAVAKKAALQSEISSTLKAFYCELCEKQFQNVAQYDEHTNSYAHHHKARFRDMQLAQRANRNTQEELEKRKEKERKREEKELRKLAKAAGIKLAKPPVSLLAPTAAAEDPSTTTSAGDSEARPAPVKKSGWATVSSPATPATSAESAAAAAPAVPSSSTSGSKRSGWATVGATASEASTSASPSTSASTAAGGATYTSSSQAQRDPAPPSQQEESAPSRAAPPHLRIPTYSHLALASRQSHRRFHQLRHRIHAMVGRLRPVIPSDLVSQPDQIPYFQCRRIQRLRRAIYRTSLHEHSLSCRLHHRTHLTADHPQRLFVKKRLGLVGSNSGLVHLGVAGELSGPP
ncbi:hypothetical protein CERSUDRAFT_79334 [Gelatoporia subvermispora B]|uniref:G-patch domain-containing protein n=1 Tax=Ceriporiopsis subvermispora (strain B) TaxID=914234 RepID=M2PXR1_CERS8|nr:hypothetical protein CERSUDRAFT_79334 [Gelatoporia subvermispora B]